MIRWLDAPQEMRAKHIMMVYSNGQGWQTTPPEQEGWYWVNADVAGYDVRFIAHFPYSNEENVDKITHWLGPLPMPEPPKGE